MICGSLFFRWVPSRGYLLKEGLPRHKDLGVCYRCTPQWCSDSCGLKYGAYSVNLLPLPIQILPKRGDAQRLLCRFHRERLSALTTGVCDWVTENLPSLCPQSSKTCRPEWVGIDNCLHPRSLIDCPADVDAGGPFRANRVNEVKTDHTLRIAEGLG